MTDGAKRLYVIVVLGGIAEEVVVLMPTFALLPYMTAINARQGVRVRASTRPHLDVDALTGLLMVTVTRWHRRWAGAASLGINSEWHAHRLLGLNLPWWLADYPASAHGLSATRWSLHKSRRSARIVAS